MASARGGRDSPTTLGCPRARDDLRVHVFLGARWRRVAASPPSARRRRDGQADHERSGTMVPPVLSSKKRWPEEPMTLLGTRTPSDAVDHWLTQLDESRE